MEQITRKRPEPGFTLVEVLVVIAVCFALAFGITTAILGSRGGMAVAVERLQTEVGKARTNALAGIEDEPERTFETAAFAKRLPFGTRLLNSADRLPVDAPVTGRVVFEPQSGLAPRLNALGKPGKIAEGWGWIILDSPVDRDRIAALIPYQPGPLRLYRFRDGKWQFIKAGLY